MIVQDRRANMPIPELESFSSSNLKKMETNKSNFALNALAAIVAAMLAPLVYWFVHALSNGMSSVPDDVYISLNTKGANFAASFPISRWYDSVGTGFLAAMLCLYVWHRKTPSQNWGKHVTATMVGSIMAALMVAGFIKLFEGNGYTLEVGLYLSYYFVLPLFGIALPVIVGTWFNKGDHNLLTSCWPTTLLIGFGVVLASFPEYGFVIGTVLGIIASVITGTISLVVFGFRWMLNVQQEDPDLPQEEMLAR